MTDYKLWSEKEIKALVKKTMYEERQKLRNRNPKPATKRTAPKPVVQ